MTAVAGPEPHVVIARDPPRRATDRHLREIVIAAIGLVIGALSMLTTSAREQGATQEELKNVRAQIATTTESLRSTAASYSNLLGVVQGQAVELGKLSVQVSTLLAQQKKP